VAENDAFPEKNWRKEGGGDQKKKRAGVQEQESTANCLRAIRGEAEVDKSQTGRELGGDRRKGRNENPLGHPGEGKSNRVVTEEDHEGHCIGEIAQVRGEGAAKNHSALGNVERKRRMSGLSESKSRQGEKNSTHRGRWPITKCPSE